MQNYLEFLRDVEFRREKSISYLLKIRLGKE
jgi:hypothetical protein